MAAMAGEFITVEGNNLGAAVHSAQQAGKTLDAGGLVIFPTETVYGVAASALSNDGLQALRRVKERHDDQPFTIHLPDADSAEHYIDLTQPWLARLVRRAFPGPSTLIVHVAEDVIRQKLEALKLADSQRNRLYHQGTVGLRCPDHALASRVLASTIGPVVASSANRRGQAPPHDAEDARNALGDAVDLIIDGGPCRHAKPSTIIRVTGDPTDPDSRRVNIQRQGVLDSRLVNKMAQWTVLFVCSGNTCRSPMAAALTRTLLAEQRGVAVEELESAGLWVRSAGAFTAGGSLASPQAVEALQKRGVDLAGHRSRPLTPELIHEADVIYCMTQSHRQAALAMAPTAENKVQPLDPEQDVEDPIGGDLKTYQRCAELIHQRLIQRLQEQQP